jgi:UDP-2-acetamido-2-deoxy-ribo-hexuluronate aminotransferase
VIVPAFTFAAAAEVTALLGASPVLVDIEEDTCNIDPELIEPAVTRHSRAIIPVGLYGQPPDMAKINAIAKRHGLAVIEDAAQSFGADYEDRKSCALSSIGCTSFFPSKPLGCYGDGGAIFTANEQIAGIARELRVHGQDRRYHHVRVGLGGRMDTFQCAVILAKLTRFEWEIEQRIQIGRRYNQLFDERGIERVRQRENRSSVFGQYTIFVDDRDRVQEEMEAQGIPTAVHYPAPLNEQPAYRDICTFGSLPVSEMAAARVLSLPMHAYLDEPTQIRIADAVAKAAVGG